MEEYRGYKIVQSGRNYIVRFASNAKFIGLSLESCRREIDQWIAVHA